MSSSASDQSLRKLFMPARCATVFLLGLAATVPGRAHAQTPAAKSETKSAPKTDAKATGKAPEKGSVKENVKQLGNEATDPTTLQRIKAHEQDLEKRVEQRRERQRKDHGQARPDDAVDLAKNLDKPGGGADAPVKPSPKATAKSSTNTKTEGAATPAR